MHRHAPVTIGVVAGDDRRVTREFLHSFAGSLEKHDNVVVLRDNGAADHRNSWQVPTAHGRLRHLRDDEPSGRWNDRIIVVEDRVIASNGWIDALASALDDDTFAAVAPRTNVADGDELLIGVPYRPHDSGARTAFLRTLRHLAPAARAVECLDGPAIAVRRSTLQQLGGIGSLVTATFEPARLCAEIRRAGKQIGVCEGAYLHWLGGPSRRRDPVESGMPFISACLIVRDEQDNLARCLSSLADCADEIVVYDTGSVDETREIAKSYGATVIDGYWDDDFSRARNAALDGCHGQWILWLDADEALVCHDLPQLRKHLLTIDSTVEGYLVLIDNMRGNDAANTLTHPACRLFRRSSGHWRGRIHEQVFARQGEADLALEVVAMLRISHWGYLQDAVAERNKAERNMRAAFGDLAGDPELEPAARVLSLARSYLFAGRLEEGCELCRIAADGTTKDSTRRLALRGLIEGLLAAKKADEALDVVAELRSISSTPTLADIHEGNARVILGDFDGALAAFSRVRAGLDEDGFEYSADFAIGPKAEALVALGHYNEAADDLLRVLHSTGGLDAHLGVLIDAIERAGRDLAEIYRAMDPARLRAFLPQLLQLKPEVADRVLEAWFNSAPGVAPVLATAAQVARRLDIVRQLVWSSRLRTCGLASACPLVASTTDLALDRRDRVLAAASAWSAFGDARAYLAFVACATEPTVDGVDSSLRREVELIDTELASHFSELQRCEPAPIAMTETARNRRVLVVSQRVSDLRAAALCAHFADLGHAVTLIHPQPARPSEQLLGRRNITVAGWAGDDERRAASLVARLYAQSRFDVVVCTNEASALLHKLKELLPKAHFVIDCDESDDIQSYAHADLILRSRPSTEVPEDDFIYLAASAPSLLEPPAPITTDLRQGVAIVANLDDDDTLPTSFDRFASALLSKIDMPCVIVGDDRSHRLGEALPAALHAGPIADPCQWFAAVRAVIVVGARPCSHWLSAATLCAAPAFLLPEADSEANRLIDALVALAKSDELFDAFTPITPLISEDEPTDPFARFDDELPASGPATNREVRFVGGVFSLDSLAQVNRELLTHLQASERNYSLSVRTPESQPFPPAGLAKLQGIAVHHQAAQLAPCAIEIRHQWPPDFSPSHAERLVLLQPWEFGGLPAEWIGPLRDVVDELWVPSGFVAKAALESGVPINKVQVIPNGVDTTLFSPEGSRYRLASSKGTKFLFVGGLIERKGVDILFETYLAAFSSADDVCLVIKPYGSRSVYRDSTLEPSLRRAAQANNGPAIEFVDETLSADELAALYRSCDVLVHPYRGEGFGLPIAEAMACQLPVIVPDAGACRDFCDEEVAWLVPSRKVTISPSEWTPSIGGAWWLVPSRTELAAAIRAAASDPAIRAQKGGAARERIVKHFGWEHAAQRASERIDALIDSIQR